MSEIVKVDGAWRIAKSQKAEFVKEYLVPYLRAQVAKRNLTGADVSLAREGFGKIFIDGKEKGISNVRRLFRENKNPNLLDKEKTQAVRKDRSEGQYGYNKETEKQIRFLDDVEKLKAEYAKNSNNPNAGKIFDNKMSALFRKNYRGRIKYDPTKEYGWPEGKSQEGYRKWQGLVYSRLKTEGKHVGHGKPVAQGGTNSASNLALEDPTSNIRTGSREGTFRSDQELENVYVAHGKSQSLQEYLAFEDDPNIMTPMDLLPEDHASLLQDLDQDPEAIFAQGLRKKENQALTTYNNGGAINVQSQSNFDRRKAELEAGYKRDENIQAARSLPEKIIKKGTQWAYENTVLQHPLAKVAKAGIKVGEVDFVGAAIELAGAEETTISPLIQTKLTHKVKQLPPSSEIEAIARDIAGKNY